MTERVFGNELFDAQFDRRMSDVHTCMPAKVLAYDAAAQTVDVRPQISRYIFDTDGTRTAEALPDLYAVPVAFPRGGGFHMSFPLAADDFVMLVFAEEPTLAWRKKGRDGAPGLFDRHGLNGAFALPCGYPDKEKLGTAPSTTDVVITSDDAASAVVVKPGGEVLLGDSTASEFVALANLVKAELDKFKADLDKVKTAFDAHIHTTSAVVATGGAFGVISPPTSSIPAPHSPGAVAAAKTKAK